MTATAASGTRTAPTPSVGLASALPMQPEDFACAAKLLKERTGIVLGSHKAGMVAHILSTQARQHGCASVAAWLTQLRQTPHLPHAPQSAPAISSKWQTFINAFTVNHTAFFRERHHFDILADFVRTRARPIQVWCAAASSGEEPYSIAITLLDACGGNSALVSVLATDIDSQALEQARRGVYREERVKILPAATLRNWFLHGTHGNDGLVSVKPILKACIRFQMLNLTQSPWPMEQQGQKFDAIFCRNTMIYFERHTQIRLLERFAPLLKKGGLLFVGHSENFTGITRAFELQGQTVYRVAPPK